MRQPIPYYVKATLGRFGLEVSGAIHERGESKMTQSERMQMITEQARRRYLDLLRENWEQACIATTKAEGQPDHEYFKLVAIRLAERINNLIKTWYNIAALRDQLITAAANLTGFLELWNTEPELPIHNPETEHLY